VKIWCWWGGRPGDRCPGDTCQPASFSRIAIFILPFAASQVPLPAHLCALRCAPRRAPRRRYLSSCRPALSCLQSRCHGPYLGRIQGMDRDIRQSPQVVSSIRVGAPGWLAAYRCASTWGRAYVCRLAALTKLEPLKPCLGTLLRATTG
jgi:hypothetical protein